MLDKGLTTERGWELLGDNVLKQGVARLFDTGRDVTMIDHMFIVDGELQLIGNVLDFSSYSRAARERFGMGVQHVASICLADLYKEFYPSGWDVFEREVVRQSLEASGGKCLLWDQKLVGFVIAPELSYEGYEEFFDALDELTATTDCSLGSRGFREFFKNACFYGVQWYMKFGKDFYAAVPSSVMVERGQKITTSWTVSDKGVFVMIDQPGGGDDFLFERLLDPSEGSFERPDGPIKGNGIALKMLVNRPDLMVSWERNPAPGVSLRTLLFSRAVKRVL